MRTRPTTLTKNQIAIWDVADVLLPPPSSIDDEYKKIVLRASMFLHIQREMTSDSSDVARTNAVFAARNDILDIVAHAASAAAYAKNSVGAAPVSNPFSRIKSLNSAPVFFLGSDDADRLVSDIGFYLDLLKNNEGQASVENVRVAQLSSVSLGLSGYSSSKNTAVDLMKFTPASTSLKEAKIKDVLSAFNFEKRVPKVIFISDYSPDGKVRGSLVGWKRIPDASGYVIKRHSVFENKDVTFQVSNEDMRVRFEHFRDYVQAWVLSFYDGIDVNSLWFFFDETFESHQFYLYKVQAYQTKADEKSSLFDVDIAPGNLSFAQRSVIIDQMRTLLNAGEFNNLDAVSPYPFIAQQFFGDSRLDWIIAGVNVRASANRKDDPAVTRSYSYLGAQLGSMFSMMDQGTFFIPRDVNAVPTAVNNAVSHFGLSQVLGKIMQDTGIISFLEGSDLPAPDEPLSNVSDTSTRNSNILAGIIASLNPETATMDLRAFSSNLPLILKGTDIASRDARDLKFVSSVNKTKIDAVGGEFSIDPPGSENQLLFSDNVKDSAEVIDLLSFDGISTLIRTIRAFFDSDFGAMTNTNAAIVAATSAPRSARAAIAASSSTSTATASTSRRTSFNVLAGKLG